MSIYIVKQKETDILHRSIKKPVLDALILASQNGAEELLSKESASNRLIPIVFNALKKITSKDCLVISGDETDDELSAIRKLANIKRFKIAALIPDTFTVCTKLCKMADIIVTTKNTAKLIASVAGTVSAKTKIITVDIWDYLMDEQMSEQCDKCVAFSRAVLEGANTRSRKWKIGAVLTPGQEMESVSLPALNAVYHIWPVPGKAYGNNHSANNISANDIGANDISANDISANDKANIFVINNNVIYEKPTSLNVLPLEIAEKCHFGLASDYDYAASIYLAAGIPIIVRAGSSLADIVSSSGCGYVIENEEEVIDIIDKLTMYEYGVICEKVRELSALIREGKHLADCLAGLA